MLVPPAGLRRKELFRGVATCFGLRALSEVASQKVSGPAAKNQSERLKCEFFALDGKIATSTQGHHPFGLPHGTPSTHGIRLVDWLGYAKSRLVTQPRIIGLGYSFV